MRRAIILLMVMLCGCASHLTEDRRISVGEGVTYRLQPPPQNLTRQGFLDRISLDRAGSKQHLLVQTEYADGSLNMVGMTVEGLVLFALNWQPGKGFDLRQEIPFPAIDIEKILAFYQLSSWPLATTNPGLEGARMQQTAEGGKVLMDGTRQIFRLENKQDHKLFVHEQQEFSLTIRLLERWTLDD